MSLITRRFKALLAIVFVSAMAVLSGCGESSNQDINSEQIDVLRRGIDAFPESLDAHKYISNQSLQVLRDIGEGLVTIASDGSIEPGAAKSWQVSSEGKSYTFELRDDLVYSDGSSVQAAHFRNAFERLFAEDSVAPSRGYFTDISGAREILQGEGEIANLGVVAVDDQTLRIDLIAPAPYFLELLTLPVAFPVVSVEDDAIPRNGAYIIKVNNSPFSITLAKNPNYWNAASVYFEEVIYTEMEPDAETRAFLAGELDITATLAAGEFQILREQHPEEVKLSPGMGVTFLGISFAAEPLNESAEIRMALNMSIDRESITEKILGRGEIPAYSFVPPVIDGYTSPMPEFASWSLDERLVAARDLLESAGYNDENPLRFTLDYYSGSGVEKIIVFVKQFWEEHLPAEVTINTQEPRAYFARLQQPGEIQCFIALWTGDYRDATAYLKLFGSGHSNNFSFFDNDRVDALLAGGGEIGIVDDKERYAEIERILQEQTPVMPLYYPVHKHLASTELVGYEPNPMNVRMSQFFARAPR